ncbi:MAG: M3 family oligoendopeptidase [Planctomycetota bacterium]
MTTPASTLVPASLDASEWEAIQPIFETLRMREVSSKAELEAWLADRSELEAACSESGARLYINMTCNTEDESASKAYLAFVENVQPRISLASFELDTVQAKLAGDLGLTEPRYEVLNRDTDADVELFHEENVPVKTELAALSQKYQSIAGSMTVEFEGETKTLPQMAKIQESTDRTRREAAWKAVASRRLEDRDAIDGVFDEMVAKRHRLARNANLATYVDYAFASMHRFDYTPADCLKFHDAVEQEIMPFCGRLDTDRKKDLGLEALKPWDLGVDPKGREPLSPFDGGADLVAKSRRVFEALDDELANLFLQLGDGTNSNGIADGHLLDLDSRRGKAPGGYQYMQDRSRRPFIFMNAAGVHRDVETMVHEAGHAFHSMLCVAEPLLHYRHSPIEFAEVASMSMELLSMPYWGVEGGFYEDEADLHRAQRKQLQGTLSLLPWIATIDAFQHWIYQNHEHTRDERTAAWNALIDRFGLMGHRVDWDDETAASRDTRWHGQGHPFGNPFYYIEYGIAQLGALQLWAQSVERGEAVALANYKKALSLGGSRPLPELFAAAEIEFDFSASMFARLRDLVEARLAEIPDA